uniref:Aminoglycoside phosphotransferase domain-containing protein n=1 Tax=Kwoniella bestiolae CBS 10118 TaxID=1296100 RepID=A0A1B9GDG0_9TREE|nr:hypothetical protein I302_00557 [Kwoniella bestiolae CBS 10118]OCF29066.1 hypothetical protein I302_00557 [Kwoniella bestiolae CBS 10118]
MIKNEVESLRPGHLVENVELTNTWRDLASNYLQGQSNFHIKINFKDGISWFMRIRRRISRNYTDEPMRMNMESEVATMNALHDVGVAVPSAFRKPSNSKSNEIPGGPWQPFYTSIGRVHPLPDMSVNHVRSLAKWFIEMQKATFDKIGSLHHNSQTSEVEVGPAIGRYPYQSTVPYYNGPFRCSADYWLDLIDSRLRLIRERRYCRHSAEIWLYLGLLEIREIVEGCEEMRSTGPFYIKHDDDQWDHIRADESTGEVTGVIDWEWSYTTSKAEAFNSPAGYVPDLFWNGSNEGYSPREIVLIEAYASYDRPDLADCVKNGRKYHRLVDTLRWMQFLPLHINSMRRAFLGLPDDHPGLPEDEEKCIEVLKEKYKDVEGLKYLLAHPFDLSNASQQVKAIRPKKKSMGPKTQAKKVTEKAEEGPFGENGD